MLALSTSCESPTRKVWHLVSGVLSLSVIWAALVLAVQWWTR